MEILVKIPHPFPICLWPLLWSGGKRTRPQTLNDKKRDKMSEERKMTWLHRIDLKGKETAAWGRLWTHTVLAAQAPALIEPVAGTSTCLHTSEPGQVWELLWCGQHCWIQRYLSQQWCSTADWLFLVLSSPREESGDIFTLPAKDDETGQVLWFQKTWHDLEMMAEWNNHWHFIKTVFLGDRIFNLTRTLKTPAL